MIVWDRIKKSFDQGLDAIRRTAVLASERARIETSVARHLIDKGTVESRLAKANQELGERVFQLWEQGAEDIMKDQLVLDALKEVDALTGRMEELNEKVREASLGEGEG